MTEPSDFETPPGQASSRSSFPTILLIIGGLGCGCFGLIIIVGIVAAIALPSLLGQVNKAKQAEAKQNVGAMVRAQQAYQIELGNFTSDFTVLGIGISGSGNYTYQILTNADSQVANN